MKKTADQLYLLLMCPEHSKPDQFWKNTGWEIRLCSNAARAREEIYKNPPEAILISTEFHEWKNFLYVLKNDLVFKHIPTVLILNKRSVIAPKILQQLPFDDWVLDECEIEELQLRIHKCHNQMRHYLDSSPLTHLPGNSSIMQKIKECMSQTIPYAIAYLDIDNFKAFNDHYGFSLGDDLIKMTARILVNEIGRISKNIKFVGHIGGDDFVFIMDADLLDECCQAIIQNFDIICLSLIDDQDQQHGLIEIENRQGVVEKFPFPSISLSVIDSRKTTLKHIGEVASITSSLKKEAKKKSGSNYLVYDPS